MTTTSDNITTSDNVMLSAASGPAVERMVAFDMVKRSLPFVPVILVVANVAAGWNGTWSAGYAIVLVLANFVLSALLLSWGASVSLAMLGMAAFFGFLMRLGLITVAVLAVKDQPWMALVPLCITLVVTHIGLLFWELRFVSTSMAFPGLKPRSAAFVKE